MEIKVDLAGALRKTAMLKQVPQATKKCLERWGASSVLALMRAASNLKKTQHKGGGALARSNDMKWLDDKTLAVGTNLKRKTASEKYAKIQDEGGTIRPKGHPYLAIPLRGIKDRPKDHPNAFLLETKKGNVLLVEKVWSKARGNSPGWRGSGYKSGLRALFLLKTEVTLPATHWFSGTMRTMESLLPGYMDERQVLAEAKKMTGLGGTA
jgi:hypothetical protein